MAFLTWPTSVVQKFSSHIGREHFFAFSFLKTYRSAFFLLLVAEFFRQEVFFNTSRSGMMEKENCCIKKKLPDNSHAFLLKAAAVGQPV